MSTVVIVCIVCIGALGVCYTLVTLEGNPGIEDLIYLFHTETLAAIVHVANEVVNSNMGDVAGEHKGTVSQKNQAQQKQNDNTQKAQNETNIHTNTQ